MIPTGTRLCVLLLALASCITYAGCSPKGIQPQGGESHGCKEPPPDTFTSVGIDARFAQSTFGKVVTGDVDVKTNPSVLSLASKAVIDARIKDYLRCLAINRDRFTPAQAVYLETMNNFFATRPTPEDFMRWQERHPFPERSEAYFPTIPKKPEPTVNSEGSGFRKSDAASSPPSQTVREQSTQDPHSPKPVPLGSSASTVNKPEATGSLQGTSQSVGMITVSDQVCPEYVSFTQREIEREVTQRLDRNPPPVSVTVTAGYRYITGQGQGGEVHAYGRYRLCDAGECEAPELACKPKPMCRFSTASFSEDNWRRALRQIAQAIKKDIEDSKNKPYLMNPSYIREMPCS